MKWLPGAISKLMKYARINLSATNYIAMSDNNFKFINQIDLIPKLFEIYQKYCTYKKFSSVMPLFYQQFCDTSIDVIGYYDDQKLIAFSLIKRYGLENAEALQFAWDYTSPSLRLGINSLKNECAVYKAQGFKYLYLGGADDYKSQLDGYEILGPLL
jgi:hypothetical protein